MPTLTKIAWIKPGMATNQRKIADYILDNPEKTITLSSQQLAETMGVSQSAIVKFSQKIGFKGFPSLKLAISEELGRKNANSEANPSLLHNQIGSEDSLEVIAQKLAQEKNNSICDTTRQINYLHFEKVIQLIDEAQRVQIIGIGGSGLVARDLSYKLQKIGITTLIETDHHVQISVAQMLSPKDLQIVISYSGKRKDMLVAASVAKKQGAKIIAITGEKHSPLGRISDYILETIADEGEWRSASISSRTAQNTITDLIFMALLKKRDECAKTLVLSSQALINSLDN
ncbi:MULTISPECIES: SIS domain-containing protein [Proteus]|uniref:SIS domain-containing protein n=1 Tax=Proteus TaxID=583 RepID=UPI000BFB546E|nr:MULTISPECIES: SIS domain-containing protein [Proteus]ATM99211.1 XRE family transcriptional regulator [Proteus vulgaris]MBG2836512.1 SIS domain-containing protein [Proteus terrae subsp. cibarius]MBG2870093.1 SIS domain-containing protein [Proteus terrae subsp. cibarius]MBJ2108855.1 SIS domain-containing protein [Proteus terrae]MBJ2132799.1 SIS domain-containing protein [Proteus terrae]